MKLISLNYPDQFIGRNLSSIVEPTHARMNGPIQLIPKYKSNGGRFADLILHRVDSSPASAVGRLPQTGDISKKRPHGTRVNYFAQSVVPEGVIPWPPKPADRDIS